MKGIIGMKQNKLLYIISIICIILDQLVKLVVSNTMVLNSSIKLISNFLHLTYVKNSGAAWSILSGQRLFLIFVAINATIFLLYVIKKENKIDKYKNIYYGLLLSGIIGNVIDRILIGSVIDYIDVYIFGYDFPIFNLADSFIFISVFMIIIENIKIKKNI